MRSKPQLLYQCKKAEYFRQSTFLMLISPLTLNNICHWIRIMLKFIKSEMVFVIALAAAVLSSFFNPPSQEWISAVDFRTLALLFCLMGVSEGFKSSGLFTSVASSLTRKAGNISRLSLFLVMIVFFSSMLFTNDVALLMFVPFTMMIMDKEKRDENYIIRIVILETIAANLGSMTTPVGNPQNIFICSYFSLDAGTFFAAILPYSFISLIMVLIIWRLFLAGREKLETENDDDTSADRKKTLMFSVFLVLALLSVFRVLDWRILFIAELAVLIIFDRKTLLKIDYILLLTFVCFFIFSANIRSIDTVERLLTSFMDKSAIATSAIVSQVISNVPAAILLSPFTDSAEGVLVGTDIGGLGTPVASLASLISMKFYFKRERGKKGKYIILFLILNFALLAILAAFSLVL